MRSQKSVTNEYSQNWDDGTYQTGASKPKKGQSAVITVLLMAVIFLGGLASALGVMNVRLLSALSSQQQEVLPMSLDGNHDPATQIGVRSNSDQVSVQQPENDTLEYLLGVRVRKLSELCRQYWDLSNGLEVTQAAAGQSLLQEGDILLSADGEALTSISQLCDLIQRIKQGSELKLEILRGRQSFTVELTVNQP